MSAYAVLYSEAASLSVVPAIFFFSIAFSRLLLLYAFSAVLFFARHVPLILTMKRLRTALLASIIDVSIRECKWF